MPRGFVWVTEATLSEANKGHPLGRGEPPVIDDAKRLPLAIIDEVGAGDAAVLMAVANARYERGLPTVVTTGMTQRQVFARYGAALWRRLTEGAEVVDVHGGER